MEIVSSIYLLTVIASVFLFYLLNPRYRIIYLVILSCGFIASYSYALLIYILIYSLFNYFLAKGIPGSRYKLLLFRTGIIVNLAQLILLKYSSFAIDPVLKILKSNIQFSVLSEVIVPLGISYFTLQGIGYLINVKMGWEKPEKNFIHFLLYITFYPKFLSGPVERSNHFLPQLNANGKFSQQQVTEGMKLILFGVFKKVAIANQLAPYALSIYTGDHAGGYISWVIFLIQPLYLYFDFSGYTDIAIGSARMFGINLLPNFNRPFFSENVTIFWKRFHISLASWFNDYIFRQASFRYRNWGILASTYAVFLTWVLFGIWHGAGWNFMLIGLLQSVAINYEFFTKKIRMNLFSGLPLLIKAWFGRILTYLFYCISMVLFFSPDTRSAFTFMLKLNSLSGPSPFNDLSLKPFAVLVYIPAFMFIELLQNDYSETYNKLEKVWLSDKWTGRIFRWTVYSVLITIIYISGLKSQQFIYADF